MGGAFFMRAAQPLFLLPTFGNHPANRTRETPP
jgi:hypothetical protein